MTRTTTDEIASQVLLHFYESLCFAYKYVLDKHLKYYEFWQKELTKASFLLSSWQLPSPRTCEIWFFFFSVIGSPGGAFFLYPLAYLNLASVWRRETRLVTYVYLFVKAFTYFFCLTELSTNFVSRVRSANFAYSSSSYFPFFECLCILDQNFYFPSGLK